RQDINHCFELITQAKEMGCWAVKFQLFKTDKLYAPEFKPQIEKMKAWELPKILTRRI
ncbi:MAG: N-acetylneuraminate synthase family protein, partial [Proteobacteria bacterium]|nr:N-acetylneuraminate synthase family protein [Pseudomonadota bacterium]